MALGGPRLGAPDRLVDGLRPLGTARAHGEDNLQSPGGEVIDTPPCIFHS
jgi:hypothetical protein